MLELFFRLSENGAATRTEVIAGITKFLTMAYIIFVQPMVLPGAIFGKPRGASWSYRY